MFKAMINFRAASETWSWILKKMPDEKHGINMGLKICLPLESLIKKIRTVICSLTVCVLTSVSKLNFSG